MTVSNNGQSDFLGVSWRPAPGEVDGYLVTLSDHERQLHAVSVSKSSPECVFNSLVSGRLYNISISSRSGLFYNHTLVQERTRESRSRDADVPPPSAVASVGLCLLSEPSKVQNPTVTHSARDDYLKVYWRHAAGDLDVYQVFIKHNNAFLQNKTVPKTQHECEFTDLVPGRLYIVLVSTWSGHYETSAYTYGRTRERSAMHLAGGGWAGPPRLIWFLSVPQCQHRYDPWF